jgi:hypothetical protein
MNSWKTGQSNLSQTATDATTKCAVCQHQKHQLRVRKSKLNNNKMLVCTSCFDKKYEPRWLVIVTAQTEGIAAVEEFVTNHRYYGDEIPAVDILPL